MRVWRKASSRAATNRLADTPAKFAEIRQPLSRYIAIPTVSSERRNFIPIALLEPEVVASNQLYVVAGAIPFHFGIKPMPDLNYTPWRRRPLHRMLRGMITPKYAIEGAAIERSEISAAAFFERSLCSI